MSDQFTSVEEKGLGTNLIDSIKGVAVGGLLFICSFVVLWMNEGRVDLSEVAKKSVVANPASVDEWTQWQVCIGDGRAQDRRASRRS